MKSKTAHVAVMAMAISGLFAAHSDNGDTSEFPGGVHHMPGATETSIEGTMEFKPDDTFELVFAAGVVTEGTYSVDGDQVTHETDSFCRRSATPPSQRHTRGPRTAIC